MGKLLIKPETCLNANVTEYIFCLPRKEFCGLEPNGFLTECDEKWNCNHCDSDRQYFIPYYAVDKTQIQTTFSDSYNADRKNPVSGFGTYIKAILLQKNESPVTDMSFLSCKMVAWGCGKSYQIIEIDTSLITDSCWSITYEVYDSGVVKKLNN